jgi:hypothetical protein
MTKIFILQLLLTFGVGSLWIYLTVLSGLKFGSKTSGFIAGLPSTALLSFFFIGFTQTPQIASEATTVFPLSMGITGTFLVVFAWLAYRGFLLAMFAAILAWFGLSVAVLYFHPAHFWLNLLIYAITMIFAFLLLEKYLNIKSVSNKKAHSSTKHMIYRSLFGGFIILMTVFIAKKGGPVMGGLFAGFPAMFISTLVISYQVQGITFSRAMTKPLLVTGMITIAVYAAAMKYLYLSFGLYWGTLGAISISAISAYLTFRYILPKLS